MTATAELRLQKTVTSIFSCSLLLIHAEGKASTRVVSCPMETHLARNWGRNPAHSQWRTRVPIQQPERNWILPKTTEATWEAEPPLISFPCILSPATQCNCELKALKPEATSKFMIHSNCEIMNVCYFKLLSFKIICYVEINDIIPKYILVYNAKESKCKAIGFWVYILKVSGLNPITVKEIALLAKPSKPGVKKQNCSERPNFTVVETVNIHIHMLPLHFSSFLTVGFTMWWVLPHGM